MCTTFDEIAENIGFLDDWEDRYRYVIELGASLPPLSESEKCATNKVHGCASQVWLVTETKNDGTQKILCLRGDSDAMIVRGLVAVLIALFSGKSAAQIANIDAIEKLDALGLREHLTSQRSNGLVAMVERIQHEARCAI